MVIAHGPTIHESGSVPYRIVLRDLGNEYVVHTECMMPDGNSSYCWGHYFRFTDESSKDTMLIKAWDRFAMRVKATL